MVKEAQERLVEDHGQQEQTVEVDPWITDRRPTEEDADDNGQVECVLNEHWSALINGSFASKHNRGINNGYYSRYNKNSNRIHYN